jgi:hypothetical protein
MLNAGVQHFLLALVYDVLCDDGAVPSNLLIRIRFCSIICESQDGWQITHRWHANDDGMLSPYLSFSTIYRMSNVVSSDCVWSPIPDHSIL